ncbi:MAG TPA: 6,7-dimethyl-8-ribityllumazine synthase [Polyangiaceae bacterium]|jgi:6,7-dimethyl-8-ribityllumazine synthase|nr:6,7-dimethyl-8-ribityllumazine synthase [Polyangiaceae bacterium]
MATRKTESLPSQLEGTLVVPNGATFAIVASRFNDFIVQALIGGARDGLVRHGADPNRVTVVRVPGAWELPPVVARLARSKRFDAVIALGAVIRGGTPHFDYVAGAVSKGVFEVAMKESCAISFGVLTTDTIEQAVDRAGAKAGNKGFEAAVAAIEMVALSAELSRAGL